MVLPIEIRTIPQQDKFGPFEYKGDLNTELVWYTNGQKEVGFQMVWFLNAIQIPYSQTI